MSSIKYIGKQIQRRPLTISGSDSSTFLKVEQASSGSTAIYTNNITNPDYVYYIGDKHLFTSLVRNITYNKKITIKVKLFLSIVYKCSQFSCTSCMLFEPPHIGARMAQNRKSEKKILK